MSVSQPGSGRIQRGFGALGQLDSLKKRALQSGWLRERHLLETTANSLRRWKKSLSDVRDNLGLGPHSLHFIQGGFTAAVVSSASPCIPFLPVAEARKPGICRPESWALGARGTTEVHLGGRAVAFVGEGSVPTAPISRPTSVSLGDMCAKPILSQD